MAKKRCYLPQTGQDGQPKQTKDKWDAYFVFDADKVPKGMVCTDLPGTSKAKKQPVSLPKAQTAVEAPEAATVTAPEPVTATAAPEPSSPTAASDEQPMAAVGETVPSPVVGADQSNSGLADISLTVVASVAVALAVSALSPSKGSVKGKPKGKAQSQGTNHPNLDQRKEERERQECGTKTETAKQEAEADDRKLSQALTKIWHLEATLSDAVSRAEGLKELADQVQKLSSKVLKLEALKASSKNGNEPRSDRSRRRRPAPKSR